MLKEYTKPVVTRVNLIPTEAALGGCKSNLLVATGPDPEVNLCCMGSTGVCHDQTS